LRAHQRAVLGSSRTSVEPVVRASESRHWALVRNTKLWKGPDSSVLDLSRAPEGAEVVLNGQLIGQAPLSSLIPAGSHRLELRLNGARLLERSLFAEAGKAALQGVEIDALAPPPEQPAPVAPEPEVAASPEGRERDGVEAEGPTAAQLIGVARRLMQQGRWTEAAFAYRELRQAYPESVEARTVLVPLGQLELDHLSHATAARELFEQYLSGGDGPLAQEARYALIRALRELGERRQEREAVATFLERFPESLEAGALRRRLQELEGGVGPQPGK
jgi:TolA-binding protein